MPFYWTQKTNKQSKQRGSCSFPCIVVTWPCQSWMASTSKISPCLWQRGWSRACCSSPHRVLFGTICQRIPGSSAFKIPHAEKLAWIPGHFSESRLSSTWVLTASLSPETAFPVMLPRFLNRCSQSVPLENLSFWNATGRTCCHGTCQFCIFVDIVEIAHGGAKTYTRICSFVKGLRICEYHSTIWQGNLSIQKFKQGRLPVFNRYYMSWALVK